MLGSDVVKELEWRGFESVCLDSIAMNVTDKETVSRMIADSAPDVVFHCAAWTDVDGAEAAENRDVVTAVNVDGTRNVAEAAKKAGAKLVYISTDYVFGGSSGRPRRPEDTDFDPLNHYGKTKLEGERIVKESMDEYFIVRTSWLFGENGRNFLKAIFEKASSGGEIRVVDDQIGTPTFTADLARILVDMALTEKYGTYHVTNECGYVSWCEVAREVVRLASGETCAAEDTEAAPAADTKVVPVTTEEYLLTVSKEGGRRPAKRPKDSRLDTGKLEAAGFKKLPDWRDAAARYIKLLRRTSEM